VEVFGTRTPRHALRTRFYRQGWCWQSHRSSILSPAALQ
jgi:hypothetical protein